MRETIWKQYSPSKQLLRQQIWDSLHTSGAVFHAPHGHIPDFIGAIQAARQLVALDIWQKAAVIKCNPDKSQTSVRAASLATGKTLYMAVPRLMKDCCFVELKREWLPHPDFNLAKAAHKDSVLKFGRPVPFKQMQPIDIAIVGCVAATKAGGRTGKGAGFADLELAMLQMFGLIQASTKIITTIHPLQLVTAEHLPLESHDWPLDWICTPDAAIATQHSQPHPQGLDWGKIQPHQWDSIPILKHLYAEHQQGQY